MGTLVSEQRSTMNAVIHNFWDLYTTELLDGEIIDNFESLDKLQDLYYKDFSIAFFTIGGSDLIDVVKVELTAGETYDFYVMGDTSVNFLGINDNNGYFLQSVDGDDVFGAGFDNSLVSAIVDTTGLYGYISADSMVGFEASTTATHYITVEPTSLRTGNMVFVVATRDIGNTDAFIVSRDENNWDNDIDTGSGDIVITVDAQLYRTYMGAMGRLPDLDGFNWWSDQISTGAETTLSMADGFIQSIEFINYADADKNGVISNDEFIGHMYNGVFGRHPDQDGYNYWIDELSNGTSQANVLIQMTQSNEYIDITIDTVGGFLFI